MELYLEEPLKNMKKNSVSKPPIIIFVICLFICASATIGMGLFIQHSDAIVNPEVKEIWTRFLSRLGTKNFCLSVSNAKNTDVDPGPIAQFIDGGGQMNATNETSVTVSGSVHLDAPIKTSEGMVAAFGNVFISEWADILNQEHPIKSLRVTFGIPTNVLNDENVCIILTFPSPISLQSTRSDVCVPDFVNKNITAVGNLEVNTSPSLDVNGRSDPVCEIGSLLKFHFKSEEFYLSNVEKLNIHLRLVHASYFLFALALSLLCLSLYRTKNYSPVVTSDRVPLTL